jgi:hypothetical protein
VRVRAAEAMVGETVEAVKAAEVETVAAEGAATEAGAMAVAAAAAVATEAMEAEWEALEDATARRRAKALVQRAPVRRTPTQGMRARRG